MARSTRFALPCLLLLSIIVFSHAQPMPDPLCGRGIINNDVCCPAACERCGGAGCGERGADIGSACCPNAIRMSSRPCNVNGPPCRLVPTPAPGQNLNSNVPDPMCENGIMNNGVCCAKECGICGGFQCGPRGRAIGTACCTNAILNGSRDCSTTGVPCRLSSPSTPMPTPMSTPMEMAMSTPMETPISTPMEMPMSTPMEMPMSTPMEMPMSTPVMPEISVDTTTGRWRIARIMMGEPIARVDACSVMVNGLVVLLGGRGRNMPVDIFDPVSKIWSRRAGPGRRVEMHQMQCVTMDGKVFIPASFRGDSPNEVANRVGYVYDVVNDEWSTIRGLPRRRRRGAAAAVIMRNFIYVVGGARSGNGEPTVTTGWVDVYNIRRNTWTINLPDLPEGRDHAGAAIVRRQICVAGGRNSGASNPARANIKSTYCYSFRRRAWMRRQDMPSPRSGAATGGTCDGRMMVAGGEARNRSSRRVDVFDGRMWKRAPSLRMARHGTGLAVSACSCGQIFIPSGSGMAGALTSMEMFVGAGNAAMCTSY